MDAERDRQEGSENGGRVPKETLPGDAQDHAEICHREIRGEKKSVIFKKIVSVTEKIVGMTPSKFHYNPGVLAGG